MKLEQALFLSKGTKIKVVNNNYTYFDEEMVDYLEITNYREDFAPNGTVYLIVNTEPHPKQEDLILCGIEDINTGLQYIIGNEGIELIEQFEF